MQIGPDVLTKGGRLTAIHLLLRAKFLEDIHTKIRDRLLLAKPEFIEMTWPAFLSTLSAIEREVDRKKQDKTSIVFVSQTHYVEQTGPGSLETGTAREKT